MFDFQRDVSKWNEAESKVFEYLEPSGNEKSDNKKYAELTFGFEYGSGFIDRFRPTKFFYGFKLYKEGRVTDQMEGEIDNANPLVEQMKNKRKLLNK